MLGVFDPEEIVFMLYMADLSRLRGKGFDTLRSKRTHMANTGIGSRLFDLDARAVGRHLFVTMERNILSISNKEIEELGKRV